MNLPRRRNRLPVGDYLAAQSLATAVFPILRMRRPLFLEGEAGASKTETARVHPPRARTAASGGHVPRAAVTWAGSRW